MRKVRIQTSKLKKVQNKARELKRYLSWNRAFPWWVGEGKFCLRFFYSIRVLPMRLTKCFNSGALLCTESFLCSGIHCHCHGLMWTFSPSLWYNLIVLIVWHRSSAFNWISFVFSNRDKKECHGPVMSSTKQLIFHHLGSAALGSVVITIFKVPRLIRLYSQRVYVLLQHSIAFLFYTVFFTEE